MMNRETFAERLEMLKNLNPKEMYAWPMLPKLLVGAAIFAAVLTGGYFGVLMTIQDELSMAADREDVLKKDFLDKKRKAINLDLYKSQLEDIKKTSDQLLKQLPDRSQIERLLIDINQAGMGRGLQFDFFRPEEERVLEYYAELPIRIKVSGSYEALGQFVEDVSKLSRVVLLKDFSFSYVKDGVISLEATAKTFRYLDPEEVASRAKATKKKKE